jgi:hypothetical protein
MKKVEEVGSILSEPMLRLDFFEQRWWSPVADDRARAV